MPLMGGIGDQFLNSGGGLLNPAYSPPLTASLMNYQPGQWSQLAYQMAGSPRQGPYPSVATPPMPAGVSNGSQSAGGSSIGGTALGILGALAKNPSALKTLGNGASSLWNSISGGGVPADVASAANAEAAGAIQPIGVSDVGGLSPEVTAGIDAGAGSGAGLLGGATAYGTDAAVAPAAALTSELPATATGSYGGLMGGADAAAQVGGGAGDAAGSSLAGLGYGAAGLGALASVFLLGNALDGDSTLNTHAYFNNEISDIKNGAAQMKALGQNPQAALAPLQFIQSRWNPATASYNGIPSVIPAGGQNVNKKQY